MKLTIGELRRLARTSPVYRAALARLEPVALVIPDQPEKHRKLRNQAEPTPNNTEARFQQLLKARERRGEISGVRYEAISLRWGGGDALLP